MAAISNLSVIISGVTSPLAKALKDAEKHVSSFKAKASLDSAIGGGLKSGLGIGLGVMGLDKMEQAMKKYIKSVPELEAAAEKVELAFGKVLMKATGMEYALLEAGKFVDRADQGYVQQEIKEEAIYWAKGGIFNHEEAKKTADWAREVFVQTKLAEQAEIRRKDAIYQRNIEESRRLREQIGGTELQDKLLKDIINKRDSLNRNHEKEQLDLALKEAPDSASAMRIRSVQREVEELEKQNKLLDEIKKNEEEMDSLMKSAADDLYKQQHGELEFLMKKFKALGANNEQMEKYRNLIEETNFLRAEEDFWKVADEEMEKELNAVSDQRANAAKFDEQRNRLAGAMSGQEAYSLIANSMAGNDTKALLQRQTTNSDKIHEINQKLLAKQGDAQKIWEEIRENTARVNTPVIVSL